MASLPSKSKIGLSGNAENVEAARTAMPSTADALYAGTDLTALTGCTSSRPSELRTGIISERTSKFLNREKKISLASLSGFRLR
jgi:hypothetical protein